MTPNAELTGVQQRAATWPEEMRPCRGTLLRVRWSGGLGRILVKVVAIYLWNLDDPG
jgi:hypothetical protein